MTDEDTQMEVEEEPIDLDPLIVLLRKLHLVKNGLEESQQKKLKDEIMKEITDHSMTGYYEWLCETLSWPKDMKLADTMRKKNEDTKKVLDDKLKDAQENLGDTEVRDAQLELVAHYHRIGDKEACFKQMEDMIKESTTVSKGTHLDLLFEKVRMGFAFEDVPVIKDNLAKAAEILKQESDWERRNRHKVYEGIFHISVRNFHKSVEFMLETIATFSCYEMMDYTQFIYYTCFVCLPIMSRPDLKKKILENSEVLAVLNDIPGIKELLNSIYFCQYDKVLDALETVCEEMERDPLLAPHTNYYFREIRVLVFKQYLASYRTVSLDKMAAAFKLTPTLLDAQLCTFIAANRLDCKIDLAANQVITVRNDAKNSNYQQLIEKGDLLLNNVTKLARVIGA